MNTRHPCACGCGGYPKGADSKFCQGHDMKLRSRITEAYDQYRIPEAIIASGVIPHAAWDRLPIDPIDGLPKVGGSRYGPKLQQTE